MMVCHCMGISDRDIRAAMDWMRAADPETLITPGKVYRALGKRADCGGCLPLFLDTMRHCDSFGIATEGAPTRLPSQSVPVLWSWKGRQHEGRPQGY